MVAKIVLDEITSSGAGITIDSTKTFTVNGSLLSAGSTNILHTTINHAIVEADVSGKSELIVTTTRGAPRDITLPLITVTGADTCIVTVIVSADATGTNSVRVMDAGSEAWTGHQKGDFVSFCVSDGGWFVVDHKETYFAHRHLTAGQTIAASSSAKVTGWTEVTEIGNMWDNANDKVITPFAGFCDIKYILACQAGGADPGHSLQPQLYIGGTIKYEPNSGVSAVGYNQGSYVATIRVKVAASTDIEFYSMNSQNSSYANVLDSGAARTQFSCSFVRSY